MLLKSCIVLFALFLSLCLDLKVPTQPNPTPRQFVTGMMWSLTITMECFKIQIKYKCMTLHLFFGFVMMCACIYMIQRLLLPLY